MGLPVPGRGSTCSPAFRQGWQRRGGGGTEAAVRPDAALVALDGVARLVFLLAARVALVVLVARIAATLLRLRAIEVVRLLRRQAHGRIGIAVRCARVRDRIDVAAALGRRRVVLRGALGGLEACEGCTRDRGRSGSERGDLNDRSHAGRLPKSSEACLDASYRGEMPSLPRLGCAVPWAAHVTTPKGVAAIDLYAVRQTGGSYPSTRSLT
jgi:hypothetical protein